MHQLKFHQNWSLNTVSKALRLEAIIQLELTCTIAQSVVSPNADPGVVSMISVQPHIFVEIDCEIFYMVILLLPLSVSYKQKYVR